MQDMKFGKEWLAEMQRGLDEVDEMQAKRQASGENFQTLEELEEWSNQAVIDEMEVKRQASGEIPQSLEELVDWSTQEDKKKPTGRPRKHEGKIKRLTIDIPADVHRQIKQVALDHDKTMTELITSALTAMIKAYQGAETKSKCADDKLTKE